MSSILQKSLDTSLVFKSKILKFQSLNTNVSLQNYVIQQTQNESTARGCLLYINEKRSYKTPPDPTIY